MCRFTVVIPTFNRSRLVQRAIESALNQTVRPDQIIVVDDGSTDNTAEACKKYAGSIEYVRQPNSGVSAARNHGIRLARHPWTAFLDSDDYWTPGYLETVSAAIEATAGHARFYFADMRFPNGSEENTVWKRIGFSFASPFIQVEDGTAWMLSQRQPSCLPCSVFSTSALVACGGFDPGYRVMEDTEIFCRLGIGGPVCAVNTVGCVETSDDQRQNRLTGIVHSHSAGYWEHEYRLWTSLLRRFPRLTQTHQRALHYNLATAHWRLTRLHWRAGRPLRSLFDLWRLANANPAFLLWLLRNGRSHGWETNVFPPCRAT